MWSDLHKIYKEQDWISKPSIFAKLAIDYFPSTGIILELGAGQGQDSYFFAEHGYKVVSTDLEITAQEFAKAKLTTILKDHLSFEKVDIREELPFKDSTFEIVYAHLAIHYFNYETTVRLFAEIQRILKPGGICAFLVNSVHDPEYKTGKTIEQDFFKVGKTTKRYFSLASARHFTSSFDIIILDESGETYKDAAKGVHNLIRFIGSKPLI